MRSSRRLLIPLLLALLALCGTAACASEEAPQREGMALPVGFPSGQVPMIDGAVIAATGNGENTWQVTIQAPATEGNAFTNAVDAMTAGGYTESSREENDAVRLVVLEKQDGDRRYVVTVSISSMSATARTSVIYLVNRA